MNEPKKILIITGAAPCVIDDLTALAMDDSQADFMAIGLDAVDRYPWPIRYCATYHPPDIPQIRARREALIGRVDFTIIFHEQRIKRIILNFAERRKERDNSYIIIAKHWTPSGSSSLLGVQAALAMGYRRIILCGCPLIGNNAKGGKYEKFQAGWEAVSNELAGRVRSMSGWTAEFLGRPTEEWLNE